MRFPERVVQANRGEVAMFDQWYLLGTIASPVFGMVKTHTHTHRARLHSPEKRPPLAFDHLIRREIRFRRDRAFCCLSDNNGDDESDGEDLTQNTFFSKRSLRFMIPVSNSICR